MASTANVLTLAHAKVLTRGTVLYHITARNADRSALRARVNGLPQTWKRSPERVRVPMKHGLYNTFQLTERDLGEWLLTDPTEPSTEAPTVEEVERTLPYI